MKEEKVNSRWLVVFCVILICLKFLSSLFSRRSADRMKRERTPKEVQRPIRDRVVWCAVWL